MSNGFFKGLAGVVAVAIVAGSVAGETRYTVKENDSLIGIANKYNTTPANLVELNPDLLKTTTDTIHPGWVLVVKKGACCTP